MQPPFVTLPGEEAPPAFFVGRREQLDRLERFILRHEDGGRYIAVKGPFGSGKTALVHKFLHSYSDRLRPLWFTGETLIDGSFRRELRQKVDAEDDDHRSVVVVLDEVEMAGEKRMMEAVAAVRNIKRVRGVIVIGQNVELSESAAVIELGMLAEGARRPAPAGGPRGSGHPVRGKSAKAVAVRPRNEGRRR